MDESRQVAHTHTQHHQKSCYLASDSYALGTLTGPVLSLTGLLLSLHEGGQSFQFEIADPSSARPQEVQGGKPGVRGPFQGRWVCSARMRGRSSLSQGFAKAPLPA